MILLYSKYKTARLCYTLDLVFHNLSGISYQVTTNLNDLDSFSGPVLEYSDEPSGKYPHIWSSGLLSEHLVKELFPDVIELKDIPGLFPAPDPSPGLAYDAFAAVFYMVSRYEEYINPVRDDFGRFPAIESLAFNKGFLDKAVVHLWTDEIIRLLKKYFPELKTKKPAYTFLPTIDVDIAFKYKYRGFIRSSGGAVRSLLQADFKSFTERFAVLLGLKEDPFDTFDQLQKLHDEYAEDARYFFLLADYGDKDKGLPPSNRKFRKFISTFSKNNHCGIHPSFLSNSDTNLLKKEIDLFQEISGYTCRNSRQHFLKLNLPETYRNLVKMGITDDYSMGFADRPGFRAGIAAPFPFFDLVHNEPLKLTIWPITFMDGTLCDYLGLSDEESFQLACRLCDHVRSVNGTLISLFHNETISNTGRFRNWNSLYHRFLSYASPLTQKKS